MLLPDNSYKVGNSYSAKFLSGLPEAVDGGTRTFSAANFRDRVSYHAGGLGDIDPLAQGVEQGTAQTDVAVGSGAASPTDALDWAKIGTAVNSEGVFIANLFRQAQGKPPLPASTAPSVNVGVTPEVQKLIIGGVAALLVGGLLLKHK